MRSISKRSRSIRGFACLVALAVHAGGAAEQQNEIATQTGQNLLSILRKRGDNGADVIGPLEGALDDISRGVSKDTAGASPQVQALYFVSETSSHNADGDDRNIPTNADAEMMQKYALGVLYFATNGEEWKECSHLKTKKCEADGPQSSSRFLSDGSVCYWFGLTCSDEQKKGLVTWIDLSHNDLAGSTPDELSLLSDNLELLWMSGNAKLVGTLPQWIGKAKNLQSLSLFDTSLGGTLPDSIYDLSKLWSLRLYGSNFEGSISTSIGKLSNLQWLWFHGNRFTGSLPSELGNLKKMEALTVHGNAFDDKEVPAEVCDLRTKSKKFEHCWTDCNAVRSCRCCTRCWPADENKFSTKEA